MIRKLLLITVAAILAYAVYIVIVFDSHVDPRALPPLESGDLIFETTLTNQTLPILFATTSTITHVGVVHAGTNGSISVIHAGQRVMESTLADFIYGGLGERILIKRYKDLTPEDRDAIVRGAEHYIGRPYNYVFYLESDRIYCSQLPYLAFQAAHKPVGDLQKIGDLHVNNWEVRKLFESRWKMHPACQAAGMDYQTCWDKVMQEPIITPISVAHDKNLSTVYDNYPY